MRILKLLNNFQLIFIYLLLINCNLSYSNEPVDIWNIEKSEDKDLVLEESSTESIQTDQSDITSQNTNIFLEEETINLNEMTLVGLYDPAEFDLKIDMWTNSDGDQIKSLINKIFKKKLSNDSKEILKIALLTNSYLPKNKITSQEFIDFKINFLIKNNDFKLIKNFLIKNENLENNSTLIKHYIDKFIIEANIEESCKLFNEVKTLQLNNYLEKFKIYCLIADEKREDAQLYFDLKKEVGFEDKFFEKKFSILMNYEKKDTNNISKKTPLDFHLSHITSENFNFQPDENTKKYIWKYLASYNLLEGINDIDLENDNKIINIEKATNNENYSETELLNLYKRFQFSLDQLLTVKKTYKLLPNHQGRALLYQRLLLTYDTKEKLYLAEALKKSMIEDDIENAFKIQLSNILNNIPIEDVPLNFTNFYENNIKYENQRSNKIKYNSKIIHQSKLINYFSKEFNLEKATKETNEFMKKIKSNKKYVFSNKDKMLLDSLRHDGVELQKKFQNLYQINPNVPTDLQVLINNNDVGMTLLRIVEIIGEDNIKDLGTETQYFIITVLNEINLDKLRNKILLDILPQRI